MTSRLSSFSVLALLIVVAPVLVQARQTSLADELARAVQSRIDVAPASARIEVGFSPEGSAERLVLKAINAAQSSVQLAAYAFTAPPVVRALIAARERGVEVRVVADASTPRHASGRSALNLLRGAGIPVRLNEQYAIHHDKYLIVDRLHVQTGSYNYTAAAARSNSENVIVIWHNAELATSYLQHWESRFEAGRPYSRRY